MTVVGPPVIFRDRTEAGVLLADQLCDYVDRPGVVVLGMPRGGVPIAYEVARILHAPMDVCVARKVGAPGHAELAMGAVAGGGASVMYEPVLKSLRVPREAFETAAAEELQEVARREKLYRCGRDPLPITGKLVILIDDGVATGSTLFAAIAALRRQAPAGILVAVPVAPRETGIRLEREVGHVIVLTSPPDFCAVGQVYENFDPVSDEEVIALMKNAPGVAARTAAGATAE